MSKGFEQLKSMENWKLLSGSHTFPGPEGGTCINEAAIVAAGFPYREVNTANDLPECFCPILGTILIRVNDNMGPKSRQKLKKYILPLIGSNIFLPEEKGLGVFSPKAYVGGRDIPLNYMTELNAVAGHYFFPLYAPHGLNNLQKLNYACLNIRYKDHKHALNILDKMFEVNARYRTTPMEDPVVFEQNVEKFKRELVNAN